MSISEENYNIHQLVQAKIMLSAHIKIICINCLLAN